MATTLVGSLTYFTAILTEFRGKPGVELAFGTSRYDRSVQIRLTVERRLPSARVAVELRGLTPDGSTAWPTRLGLGLDDAVDFFIRTVRPWLGGSAPIISPHGEAPSAPYVTVAQELQEQLGQYFVTGQGRLRMTSESRTIEGVGVSIDTSWLYREIRVEGDVYRVDAVHQDGSAQLGAPYSGESGEFRYGMGPRIVGLPWETRLPTALVMLAGHEQLLPTIENR